MYGEKRIDKTQVVSPPSVISNHQVHLHHHHHLRHQSVPIIVQPSTHVSHTQHQNHHHHHQLQHQQQQQQQHLQSQPQHQQPSQSNQNNQQQQQQQQSTMFTRFDANKSTKGASKLRRDLINAEIANLRDLLPLPQSTRQRLSQLQLMALVCVYVRKANYFQQVLKRHDIAMHHAPTPNIGFSKALSGFLMMLTQNGKLLYISDNAAEYLGHSMEDLLIHGDSVYDIIDKQDHSSIQAELNRNVPQQPGQHGQQSAIQSLEGEHRMFLCRMNVSRNARRQMRFGDQKVVLVQGRYLSFLPLCSRNEPVFLATCTPIAMPETRECVVQGATNVFTTIHSMDMKIVHIDKNGEFHLGYSKTEIQGLSWYNLLHWDNIREAQNKHRLITQSEQDRSCILLVRMQRFSGEFIWVHVVLQVRDGQDSNQQSVIVCTNQVLNEREASVMLVNSWLYHYYSVQSKIQFGIPFEGPTRLPPSPSYYHHTHHHSPTALPPTLSHGYPHHHLPYGYHSPVGIPSQSSPIMGHHNGNNQNGNGVVGPYSAYRIDITTASPVDYSNQNIPLIATPPEIVRCSSTNSSSSRGTPNSSHQQNPPPPRLSSGSPPPSKRRQIVTKLEPLYIIESNHDSPESNNGLTDLDSQYCTSTELGSDHGGVAFGTILPARPRILTKAPPADPPDLIDQWNPSPPWSETAQKVPDIAQQELSPYLTTTPPTPTSAPPIQTIGPAFSFDWMSEQFVPIMDPCLPPPEKVPFPVQISHHWQMAEHRLLALEPAGNINYNENTSDVSTQGDEMDTEFKVKDDLEEKDSKS